MTLRKTKQMKKSLVLLCLVQFLFFLACSSDEAKQTTSEISSEDINKQAIKSAKNLFYNMYLPCELVFLFDHEDIPFKSTIINPPSNVEQYITIGKKAINLGVYGVDMGYLKYNNQEFGINDYYVAISKLSRDIGIPDEYVLIAVGVLDQYMHDVDSMYKASCELYEVTDSYLTTNEQQSTAALIILGGWIEAMYITSNLREKPTPEIMNRFAKQKFSLQSLISYLKIYQDHPLITNYLISLNKLATIYDEIEVYFENENMIIIDTVNRIIDTSHSKTEITEEQFQEIRNIISRIRKNMVSV